MITTDDVYRWLEDFDNAKRTINNISIDESDKRFLLGRMNDGIYLVTLIESLMKLEEPDGVLEKAKMRQTKGCHV